MIDSPNLKDKFFKENLQHYMGKNAFFKIAVTQYLPAAIEAGQKSDETIITVTIENKKIIGSVKEIDINLASSSTISNREKLRLVVQFPNAFPVTKAEMSRHYKSLKEGSNWSDWVYAAQRLPELSEKLKKAINADNVRSIYEASVEHGSDGVKAACLKYIEEHADGLKTVWKLVERDTDLRKIFE